MPLASNLSADKRFIAMFVGPKHSGKTVAACSCLHKSAVDGSTKLAKVFDFDGRINGLLGAPWIDRALIDYTYYPPRLGRGQSIFEKVNADCEAFLVQCLTGQSPYGTAIMDSLTSETFALLCDAIPLTHNKQGNRPGETREVGKRLGVMAMPGPEDYGFEANGTYQLLAFLRSLPLPKIIVTAHITDKFGKPPGPDGRPDPYAESIVVGEKLSVRDKIGTNSMIYFDHIFRFERRMVGDTEHFFVRFRDQLACTSYPQLPEGEVDITGKDFYNEVLLKYVKEEQLKP